MRGPTIQLIVEETQLRNMMLTPTRLLHNILPSSCLLHVIIISLKMERFKWLANGEGKLLVVGSFWSDVGVVGVCWHAGVCQQGLIKTAIIRQMTPLYIYSHYREPGRVQMFQQIRK